MLLREESMPRASERERERERERGGRGRERKRERGRETNIGELII